MLKRITLLLLTMTLLNSLMAVPQKKAVRNKVDKNAVNVKNNFNRGGLVETVILTEDFSKFTAGSIEDPDNMRLDDIETTMIDDEYFNSPGWSGIEIYQAGGCAYIGFDYSYNETGLISTPLINTEGAIYINCKMRSENPEGDLVGYNIVDENWDAIDSNVDFFEITDEWTEISWFTTSGCDNSYIYIFAYSNNVFIDDIEIVSCSMPTPVLLDETNVTDNAFTANWEAVDDIDTYIFKLFAEHTATADETFYYTNTDFSSVESEGTMASPETVEGWETTIDNWHIYMPVLIDEAIGITGRYSSIEQYGAISSPVFDLSSDNGNVKLAFKAHGNINDILEVNLITPAHGYYDVASSATITIEKEGWNEYLVTLPKGMEDSYIDITYFGLGDIFIDDLRLYQDIDAGEIKILSINYTETANTSCRVKVEETYLNDRLYYQVSASKFIYNQTGEKIIGYIDSDFTEERTVTLGGDSSQEGETISIGNGELNTTYAPVSNYGNSSNFSLSQQIYTKEEINKENGTITSISFHNNLGNANIRNIVIYMSNTEQASYRDNKDWVFVDESEIVYESNHTFGAQGEWSTIVLEKPFVYTGENIAVTIYDKSDISLGYNNLHDSFYANATDTLRGLYRTASTKINVYNLEEVYGYELKTSIYTTPANQYYVNNIKLNVEPTTDVEETNISSPKNIAAYAIDSISIRVSWTNVKDATSYKVYRDGNEVAYITTTSYLDENLEHETRYCYTVTALNGDLESEKSEEVCATTLAGTPNKPDSLEEIASSFNIYPNPVENELFLATDVEVEEITIYDIYGKICTDASNASTSNASTMGAMDTFNVSVQNLEAGVYFVKIVTSEGEIVKRFVKK